MSILYFSLIFRIFISLTLFNVVFYWFFNYFEYFLNNTGKTVFAKDLAELLELPRDYVYKYIKNLRAKIEGDKLKNVPSGGFILTE